MDSAIACPYLIDSKRWYAVRVGSLFIRYWGKSLRSSSLCQDVTATRELCSEDVERSAALSRKEEGGGEKGEWLRFGRVDQQRSESDMS